MSIANVPNQYLTIAEVATMLRVSKMTVYRLARAHALASVRFGNSYRIPENAVEEYIKKAGTCEKRSEAP
ncbi:helix-turn-helix domain-containing protein [Arthrobacter sp. ISL-65]|uniref:helix-turn-helix domain-containing protein n=1 Tax=Arthrobacter sp. ISL-65 TaxID=2819112 RepID=UPI001BEA3D88|nr:helix-turn-helix domain-containing protein [Arthrobacter sp. ISL-65]MBT2550418.1 helix-turn-helix domain-containing protein [Arthrobacter sp. ISL-65]